MFPDWSSCDCPMRCKAHDLDEHWDYDYARHIKAFVDAKFICRGCHWLKSPGFRILTWRKPPPLPSPFAKPPHIIACLGWTQERVDKLRQSDLRKDHEQRVILSQIGQQIQQGKAVALPSPIERVPASVLDKLVEPGQIMVVPWRVDLTRLSIYSYSPEEIQRFEKRMYDAATKRMQTFD